MKKNSLKILSAMLAAIMLLMPFAVFAAEGVTYERGAALQVGEFEYEASALEYTVYTFSPEEIGKYTFSSENLMGISSYNGMWVTVEPNANTVSENTVTWDCTSVGQEVWLSVQTNGAPVTINIEKEDITIVTIPTVAYENTVTPEPFAFGENEDTSTLVPVDVTNSKIDDAVFCLDGYYRLNSENGPRLFVDLNDTVMPLFALREPGQLSSIVYNDDGSVDHKLDYNAAFDEYWACADANGFYPLTYDLVTMLINIGEARDWYGEGGWLGYTADDAWMFCCYYLEAEQLPYDMGSALEVGENEYAPCDFKYTIYTFDPTEVGNYVISSDAPLGIVSYNGMWLTVEPDETTVTENSVSWNCESVGQAIWVAALTNGAPVTINIVMKEIEIITMETIAYENTVVPEPFAFAEDEDTAALVPVDVTDGKNDVAVLGDDGFYHLNNKYGPRLFVNFVDTNMAMYALREPGQISSMVYKEDGTVDYKLDYNAAFDEYWECSADGFYPLTEDLISMYANVGEARGWYGEEGWLGYTDEDAWMFACYYFEGENFDTSSYTVTIDGVVYGTFEAGTTVEIDAVTGKTVSGFFARFFTYNSDDVEVTRSAYNKANTVNGRTYSFVMPSGDVALTTEFVIIGNLYNSDSKVNSRDTAILKKFVNNPATELTEQQKEAADIELDGKINSRDTLSMKKLANGTYTPKK